MQDESQEKNLLVEISCATLCGRISAFMNEPISLVDGPLESALRAFR
jgi:hypothetical protein